MNQGLNLDAILQDWERTVLIRAARGESIEQIQRDLGLSNLRKELARQTYPKLGVNNINGAVGRYANWQGLRGNPLTASARDWQAREFKLGKLQYPARLLCSDLYNHTDVTTDADPQAIYEPSPEIQAQLPLLRAQVAQQAAADGRVLYEKGLDIYVVSNVRGGDERWVPLHLILQRAGYITYHAVHRAIPPFESREFDPYRPDPTIPCPMAVSLHIIAGNRDKKLLVSKRSDNLAVYGGYYGAAIEAYGETGTDDLVAGNHTGFNFVNAMTRELIEERGARIKEWYNLHLLTCVYDYRISTYDLSAVAWLEDRDPLTLKEALSSAKEGDYELLPWPNSRRNLKSIRAICDHLLTNPWEPAAAISLVVLLERYFGARLVYPLLGAPYDAK